MLNLSQEDVKALSNSNGELADAAKKVFAFRQGQAHQATMICAPHWPLC